MGNTAEEVAIFVLMSTKAMQQKYRRQRSCLWGDVHTGYGDCIRRNQLNSALGNARSHVSFSMSCSTPLTNCSHSPGDISVKTSIDARIAPSNCVPDARQSSASSQTCRDA